MCCMHSLKGGVTKTPVSTIINIVGLLCQVYRSRILKVRWSNNQLIIPLYTSQDNCHD